MALHGHSFSNNSFVLAWTFIFPINYIGYHLRYNVWGERGGAKTLQPQSNRLLTEHLSPIDFTRIAFSSRPSSIQTKSLSFHWNTVMRWMKKTSFNQCSPIFFLFNIYKIDICNVHIRKLTLVFITRISNQVEQLHHCLYQLGASG